MINLLNKKQKQPHQKRRAFSLIELSIVIIIIGLIIAGITGAKSLINQSKLSAARMLTQSSAALGSEDMVLWFDASSKESYIDGEGIIDGSDISTLKDTNPHVAEGDRNDATQTVAADKPHYIKDAFNGLPAIRGDIGSNIHMSLIYPDKMPSFGSERTIFIAVSNVKNVSGIYKDIFYQGSGAFDALGNGEIFTIALSKTNIAVGLKGSRWGSETLTNPSNMVVTVTVPENANTDDIIIRRNGSEFGAKLNAGSVIPINTSNIATTLDMKAHDYNIHEVIVYSRKLSNTEIERIEDYLIEKWEIDT